ncbi:MAG: hypothetical protein ACQEP8_04525 [Chlamydiota bacterium]
MDIKALFANFFIGSDNVIIGIINMKKIIVVISMITILLQGCASYQASALPSADVMSFSNNQEQDNLHAAVKFFNAAESKKMFGTSDVYSRYQPVYIVIDNRTKDAYEFKKRMLNKTTIPAEEVAAECGFSTAGRATAYGVAGLFVWPLLIPAVVDGVGSANANERMGNDYMNKEINDERIPSNGLLTGIAFLEKMKDGELLVMRMRSVDDSSIKLFEFKK